MKKLYSFLGMLSFTALSFAQNTQLNSVSLDPSVHPTNKTWQFNAQHFAKNKNKKTAVVQSGWFCTGQAFDDFLNFGTATLRTYPLFADTMGKFTFSNGNYSTSIHALGEVVDPKGLQFVIDPSTDFIVNPTPQIYSLDSMSIVYGYERNTAANIVDTLIITVASNSTASNLGGGYYPASTSTFVTNYGTDTLQLHRPKYTYTTQNLNAVGAFKFKIPLTSADTAVTFLREKLIQLPNIFVVPATKVLIASVIFKPGYAYTEGDVISSTGNAFYFASYEEKGAGTYPTYNDCNYLAADCDFSNSSIVNSSVRYNVNASGFNGSFLPSYVFSIAYAFEHHLISFRLTAGNVGVNQISKNNTDFGMEQNVPNPYTKESTVKYTLAKDVNSAVFTVTDVMGRVISTESVSTSTGTHNVKLGAFASGVYYYSLNVDGAVITKKMIVE